MPSDSLLNPTDPAPVQIVNEDSDARVILVCEHAGNAVPQSLANLGLNTSQLGQHVAIDIGAAAVAHELATIINAPLVLQNYSRLVIDCNRPPDAPDAVPATSHGVHVPANTALDASARSQRVSEIFTPYDMALKQLLETHGVSHAFSIHSFTPSLNEEVRPWDIGLLYRNDNGTSVAMASYLEKNYPELCIGLNQPYQIDDASDWFVPRHAERLKLSHSLIEIRNDHITDPDGQHRFATILSETIAHVSSTGIQ